MTKNMGRDFWRTRHVVNNKSNIKIQFKLAKLLITEFNYSNIALNDIMFGQYHQEKINKGMKDAAILEQRTWSQQQQQKKKVTKVGLVLKKNEMLTFQKKVRIRAFHNHQSFDRFLVKKSNVYLK